MLSMFLWNMGVLLYVKRIVTNYIRDKPGSSERLIMVSSWADATLSIDKANPLRELTVKAIFQIRF